MSRTLEDLTPTDRRDMILRRVTDALQAAAPEDVCEWPPLLDYVGPPVDRFLDLLAVWLYEDNPATRQDLQKATDALVRAWREAGRGYVADKRADDSRRPHEAAR